MATHQAEGGGAARADGAAVVRRVDAEAFERSVQILLDSIDLAAGVRTWATVRLDDGGGTLQVRAANAEGTVTASRDLPLPAEARRAIEAAVDEAEPALRDELKRSIARTLAAAALGIGQEA